MKRTLFAFFFIIASQVYSQTYFGAIGNVSDDGLNNDFPNTVSGLLPPTIDGTHGLVNVCLDISHTWDSDLVMYLIAPDGTTVTLVYRVGGSDDNFTQTCFDQNATISILNATAPFTGSFIPQQTLGNINNGQNGNGTWILRIVDVAAQDTGVLHSWSLAFGANAATPFVFTSSNLPIMVINTGGNQIPDSPKIMADMGIVYNGIGNRNYRTDPFNDYNGKIGIEVRGSSSQMFPKKSYGFETWDTNGIQINAALLGMPAESDWVLHSSYSDKTLMHNMLSYKLYEDMGHYSPRTKYLELFIDGEYQGVFLLVEKIKRSNVRVNIAKLPTSVTSGDSLTGGYIWKIDKFTGSGGQGWRSNYPSTTAGDSVFFQYEYPKADSITSVQQQYIASFVDSFETALIGPNFADPIIGYRRYISVPSFIDNLISNEISKNIDGYRLSTFFYKDKTSNGGRIKNGPVWDYDIAWHNADYYGGDDPTGWQWQFPGDGYFPPFYWTRLMQDPIFVNDVLCRWLDLRTNVLDTVSLDHFIDSIATYLDEGQIRNFTQWPILGVYVWPNPSPIPTTYQGEVDNLKIWIHNRFAWIDNNLPGFCSLTSVKTESQNQTFVHLYPNPAKDLVLFSFTLTSSQKISLIIYDVEGREVKSILNNREHAGECVESFDINTLKNGMYIYRFISENFSEAGKLLIQK